MEKDLDNILLICPNEEKINILNDLEKENNLHNIKFMTKEEFCNNYFFSYDEKTLFYLLEKYNFNLDVAKVYIKSLYPIDIKNEYENEKLKFLRNLKQELLDNNLITLNDAFKEYLKGKKIIVKNYYNLDKYEEEALGFKVTPKESTLNCSVVECETLEDEVNDVCLKIIDLLNNGTDINKIFLYNVSSDYLYTTYKLFEYYNLPINLDIGSSIYSSKIVNDFLKTKEIDLSSSNNITRKLVNILNDLSDIDNTKKSYETLLIDKLKSTSLKAKKIENAVNIKDIYKCSIKEDEHIFVLGFNQDILPKMEKDIAYITDSMKNEVNMYTTKEKNRRNKKILIEILSNIKNLHISYKKSSPFSSFYPSSLIKDLGLNIIKPKEDSFNSSNLYNELRLGEKLDQFYKYKEFDTSLNTLNSNYQIPYRNYSNDFTYIDSNLYLNNIKYPLNISYSSMDDYSKCGFKYYIKNVLKLSNYEEKFPNFIGNLYHRILSLYERTNFDFENEFNKYLENKELTFKERMLLIKIKKELIDLIEKLKRQKLLTGYDNSYLEKKIEIPLNKKVPIIFKGFVDKIMYFENYFSVIDYKTGTVDTNIEPMKYGLNMQLPIYLYLIKHSSLFQDSHFTGIYYQNILFNYPTCVNEEEYLKVTKDRLKLQGYSTEDTSRLSRFDSTYEKSEVVKSMAYSEEKGFTRGAKVISDTVVDNMVKYTEYYINETTDKILEAKFDINPKYYNGTNVSCEFCEFKDLCFVKDKDIKYLEKQEDLSFLGGDIDG